MRKGEIFNAVVGITAIGMVAVDIGVQEYNTRLYDQHYKETMMAICQDRNAIYTLAGQPENKLKSVEECVAKVHTVFERSNHVR